MLNYDFIMINLNMIFWCRTLQCNGPTTYSNHMRGLPSTMRPSVYHASSPKQAYYCLNNVAQHHRIMHTNSQQPALHYTAPDKFLISLLTPFSSRGINNTPLRLLCTNHSSQCPTASTTCSTPTRHLMATVHE